MRAGSLFSGIGGFDLAFERAGFEIAFQCEIDPACRKVLAHHWPGVEIHEDVSEINGASLPTVDILCGGFPCQDLSVAGRRAGLAGERSGLFFEFMRIIDELSPAWVVIENVLGLLSSNGGRDMGTVLGTLAKLGYGYAYRVLDAQYFGVAQRRRRVFIVGHLGKPWSAPAKVLFEPESCDWDSPPSREKKSLSASLLASGAGTSRPAGVGSEADFAVDSPMYTLDGHRAHAVATTLTSSKGDGRRRPDDFNLVAHTLCASAGNEDGTGRGTLLVAYPLHAGRQIADSGGNEGNVVITPIRKRMSVRRLTPLECSRLQGFPDTWLDIPGLSDSARYRMLGNAVCVNVVEWIARRLMKVMIKGGNC